MALWDGGHGGPPKTSHSHICVTTAAQFGCSSLKSVVIDREEPQNLGALGYALWGGGVADPLKQAPTLYVLSRQIWYFCVKRYMHK